MQIVEYRAKVLRFLSIRTMSDERNILQVPNITHMTVYFTVWIAMDFQEIDKKLIFFAQITNG